MVAFFAIFYTEETFKCLKIFKRALSIQKMDFTPQSNEILSEKCNYALRLQSGTVSGGSMVSTSKPIDEASLSIATVASPSAPLSTHHTKPTTDDKA